ncbi:MAG: ABC transporter substrate-binding protein [Acidimicrobiales bacterium]
MDRRDFMQRGAALVAILATGSLTACGDDADDATAAEGDTAEPTPTNTPTQATTEPAEAEPEPGGSIRVALLASPTDTLNPATTTGLLDYAVLYAVHDSLVLLQGDQFVLQLAESIEPNADGSEWTIQLREGPTFHDGSPVTAADVLYSIGLHGASPNYAQFFALIDLANMSTPDDRTVVLPMTSPRSDLVESVLGQLSIVVPDGFSDWGTNIGSGPFLLESYEAGVGAVVTANPDYWGGAPSLERVEFISIADATTKANALTSGEVEYVSGIDAAAAATLDGADGVRLVVADETTSVIRCFAFNRQQAPFDDPRVVQACKLAVDRQQLIDVVTFGNATLGNDMPSLGFAGYPSDVPQRERDVEEATRLFAEAGVTEFTIRAADFVPGIVASAELFAQNLADCGVTATVDVGDPATYFSDFAQVLSTPCQSFYFINRPAITLLTSYTGSSSPFNVFGSGDADYDAALAAAVTTIDPTERETQLAALLETVRDQEGWLIWAFEQQIDASVEGLEGIDITQSVPSFATATLG